MLPSSVFRQNQTVKKQTLKVEYDYDFTLLGIVCYDKDYRLCYEINKELSIELLKEEDRELIIDKQKTLSSFSSYLYEDEEEKFYYLIVNKGSKGLLLPEQKQMDYFLMLKGNFFKEDINEITLKLKQIPIIIGVYPIEVVKLKSKENLLF